MSTHRTARALLAVAVALSAAACSPSEQSPVPSRSAAASPVQAPPDPKLVEFEGRVADALKRNGQLVRDLSAASAGSSAQLALVARQMTELTTDELAWLDDHPAAACYKDASDAYRSGLTDIAAAAAGFAVIAAASAPPSDEDGQAAGQSLANGTASLEEAAALAKSARAACR